MARAQSTAYNNGNGTVASYIASNKPISDAMKAVFTQTADTGQVVWSGTGVVTSLPATNTIRDFEIYRLNDSLQSTSPIFVRLNYLYNSATNVAYQSFQVGTGTDGAGNLTGATAVLTLQTGYPNTNPLYAFTSNGDGSLFSVVLGLNPYSNSGGLDPQFCGFTVERFRNADGTASAEGFNINYWSTSGATNGTAFNQNISRNNITTPALAAEPNVPVVIPNVSGPTTAYSGSVATAFPFYTWGPQVRGASQAVLYGYQGDWPRDAEVTITHYGRPMKFLALGAASLLVVPFSSGQSASTRSYFSPLFRWE